MVQIPSNKNTTKWKLNNTPFETPVNLYMPRDNFIRDYCGLSGIGHKCLRALQYSARRASKETAESPKVNRIFDMGHILEAYMVLQLENIGIEVDMRQATVNGFGGHWKGHIDGRGLNIPEAPKAHHLLEFKTHNLKNFTALVKQNVELAFPVHYAQVMRYMHGLELDRGLYVAFCKDNCEYHCERIYYSERQAMDLVHKEQEILLSNKLFPRIGNGKPTWYDCKYCTHHSVCYRKEPPNITCRTCAHVDMEDDGIWRCSLDKKNLSYEDQLKACKMYQIDAMFS